MSGSVGQLGMRRGVEPTARIILAAVWVSVAPSGSVTVNVFAPASRPWPWSTVTPRALNSPLMPPRSLAMVLVFRFWIAAQSKLTSPSTVTPSFFAPSIACSNSADASSALLGMQPMFRHVPPKYVFFSTIATDAPSCAALRAAMYPPGPDPITAISNVWLMK